ncbi:MAG: DNA repair protein RadC [Gammaproteobacteria bacterium]|nr:DNA repair protein RadC [Gammaproteobacteria bacterium]
MSIQDWPEEEQPREKLLALGAEQLSDKELLAIFLRTGVKGKSAVDLAAELLQQFSGLQPLLEASLADFSRGKGLGKAKYCQLQATLEIAKRYLHADLRQRDIFENPESVRNYLSHRLRHQQRECFLVLFLDNRHRLLGDEILFEGTINQASVYPREVVKKSLHYNAAALIVAHNHPSGVSEPSQADISITHRLDSALKLIEVRLLDHMVVGEGSVVSLAERGLFLSGSG